MHRPTQLEIDEILDLHKLHTIEPSKGKIADFSDMDLTGRKFNGAALHQAKFSSAILNQCEFNNCQLIDADFSLVAAKHATFNNCDLDSSCWASCEVIESLFVDSSAIAAEMWDADFSDSMFLRTDLNEANFSKTNLTETQFTDSSLTDVVGNASNIISLQLGGFTVVYTATTMQIGKYDMTIDDWKLTWACGAQNIECENCQKNIKSLLHIAATAFVIIEQFPATPLSEA